MERHSCNQQICKTNSNDDDDVSIDSSLELSGFDSTSTLSLNPQSYKKQMPRFDKVNFDKQPISSGFKKWNDDVMIGFKDARGKKSIKIGESKVKKAMAFFDDDDEMHQFSCQPMHFNQKVSVDDLDLQFKDIQHSFSFQMSMPCFKTVGKGIEIRPTQQYQLKAAQMLRDSEWRSKSTKFKDKFAIKAVDFAKTVGNQEKKDKKSIIKVNNTKIETTDHPISIFKDLRQQYLCKDSKKVGIESLKKKNLKKSTASNKKSSPSPYIFKMLRLSDLPCPSQQALNQFVVFFKTKKDEFLKHNLQICKIRQCLLCRWKYQKEIMDVNDAYDFLIKGKQKDQFTIERFQEIFAIVQFKLMKYQYFYPDIINKRYNPSNLLLQIHKKLLNLKDNSNYCHLSTAMAYPGKAIILSVISIQYSTKINAYCIGLTDGWKIVFAVIQEHNLLHKIVKLIKIGQKIRIQGWVMHPIGNIGDFFQEKERKTCIQIYWNGTSKACITDKLGFASCRLHRPLNRCRAKGGPICYFQASVLRIFSPKSSNKSQQNAHYLQILTSQNYSVLMRFTLGQESSLVDWFRLYHQYQFWKVRIGSEGLCGDGCKFQEISVKSNQNSQQRQRIKAVLQSRLITKAILSKNLKLHELYDFTAIGLSFSVNQSYNFTIIGENQAKTSPTSLSSKPSLILYQQFELIEIDYKSKTLQFQRAYQSI